MYANTYNDMKAVKTEPAAEMKTVCAVDNITHGDCITANQSQSTFRFIFRNKSKPVSSLSMLIFTTL